MQSVKYSSMCRWVKWNCWSKWFLQYNLWAGTCCWVQYRKFSSCLHSIQYNWIIYPTRWKKLMQLSSILLLFCHCRYDEQPKFYIFGESKFQRNQIFREIKIFWESKFPWIEFLESNFSWNRNFRRIEISVNGIIRTFTGNRNRLLLSFVDIFRTDWNINNDKLAKCYKTYILPHSMCHQL